MQLEETRVGKDITSNTSVYKLVIDKSPFRNIINKSIEKQVVAFRKNDLLYNEDELANGIFFIVSGKVKIVKNFKRPNETMLHLARPGDVLGINAVINEHAYTNAAAALSNTVVCFVPAREFLNILENDVKNKFVIMQLLCSKIDLMENKINSVVKKSTRERFIESVMSLIDTYGTTQDKYVRIELTLDDLASMVGTTSNYLHKIIMEFEEENLIRIKEGKIKIVDFKKLEELAAEKTQLGKI